MPGGLGIANVFACALFAAMAGSSPATCSAIGSAGIPEMRKRGYSGSFAAGIIAAGGTLGILLPPSITMILYAVAAEQSLGRLFLAAIGPALLLVGLFAGYAMLAVSLRIPARPSAHETRPGRIRSCCVRTTCPCARQVRAAAARAAVRDPAHRRDDRALWRLRHAVGDGGPRRAAGAAPDRGNLQRAGRPRDLKPILLATLRESTMLMFIIGMSLLYSYVMSYLHISQSAAQSIVELHLSRWVLLAAILVLVVVLGFFLPPVSIILMTAPIILPPLKAGGFDLIWFGVVMTIVMEMGLIHPPVGLEPVRHQEHRARHSAARRDLGRAAVRRPDAVRRGPDVRLPRHRDLVPGRGHGWQIAEPYPSPVSSKISVYWRLRAAPGPLDRGRGAPHAFRPLS